MPRVRFRVIAQSTARCLGDVSAPNGIVSSRWLLGVNIEVKHFQNPRPLLIRRIWWTNNLEPMDIPTRETGPRLVSRSSRAKSIEARETKTLDL